MNREALRRQSHSFIASKQTANKGFRDRGGEYAWSGLQPHPPPWTYHQIAKSYLEMADVGCKIVN